MNSPKQLHAGINATLNGVFGVRRLRPGQQDVIDSVLGGRDTLAIMPSGAGKSLCYQLPGHFRQGTTVIVSPLISLMRDQAEKLEQIGLDADQVNSSLSSSEENGALQRIGDAQTEFVFATPERMEDPEFLELLRGSNVSLFVVDEAHCISQWGHDFRPAYLSLANAIESLGHPTVLALTATATDQVSGDILQQLRMRNPRIVNAGVYRENLHYRVIPVTSEEDRIEQLMNEIHDHDGAGIIYCATVKAVEHLADRLEAAGESVTCYHGQLSAKARAANQDALMNGDKRIMVATNAFGMGIDKSDIRFITHFQMPGTLEAYYQESGRAGRDGKRADCTLLYYPPDKRIHQFFLMRRFPDADDLRLIHDTVGKLAGKQGSTTVDELFAEVHNRLSAVKTKVALKVLREAQLLSGDDDGLRVSAHPGSKSPDYERAIRPYVEKDEHDHAALERMIMYAQSGYCRWRLMLTHFGEEPDWMHCGHCDSCDRPPETMLTPASPAKHSKTMPGAKGERAASARFSEGQQVTTKSSGTGKVVRIADDKATVQFPDGSSKTFLMTHLRPV